MQRFGPWARVVAFGAAISLAPATLAQEKAPAAVSTQASAATLQFDVASVKRSASGSDFDAIVPLGPGNVYTPTGGSFTARGIPLVVYIEFAYKITSNQGPVLEKQLPEWVKSDRYDIDAKTDNHNATKDELRLMMRALLADRFHLVVRSETQVVPAYLLVEAKPGVLGPKLRPHPADAPCSYSFAQPGDEQSTAPRGDATIEGGFPAVCGGILGMPGSVRGRFAMGGRDVTMEIIADTIGGFGQLDKPLVDHTGLQGKYDFVLQFDRNTMRADAPGGSSASTPEGLSFGQALKEQLGLKYESGKAPVQVWVVDHVERAAEN